MVKNAARFIGRGDCQYRVSTCVGVLTAARPGKTWVVNTGYTVNTCFFENIFICVEHAYMRKKEKISAF